MQLANQIAIVTGASRGLGRAIAWSLAGQGATVVAAARSLDKLAGLADEARKAELPGSVVPRVLDVTDRAAAEAFVDAVAEEFKKIDILVNNAGITRDSLLMNMEDQQFDEVIAANLKSVFWLTRAASRYMVRSRYGRIVNIASVSGMVGNAGQSNYAASKAGVIGFSKSVAKELARRNITCNVIAPGFIATDMTDVLSDKIKEEYKQIIPCRRFGEPKDVAAAAAFFASPAAAYVTGQVLAVDGGMTM
ncbi:MAG: 3-oxoacyl-[acyl-carrier-protein] reductase [Planctomycetes bacterium]|nr:3-oxoacyl-[acyl-carrier-protein] reductase [Planctomycetota bacterium]